MRAQCKDFWPFAVTPKCKCQGLKLEFRTRAQTWTWTRTWTSPIPHPHPHPLPHSHSHPQSFHLPRTFVLLSTSRSRCKLHAQRVYRFQLLVSFRSGQIAFRYDGHAPLLRPFQVSNRSSAAFTVSTRIPNAKMEFTELDDNENHLPTALLVGHGKRIKGYRRHHRADDIPYLQCSTHNLVVSAESR